MIDPLDFENRPRIARLTFRRRLTGLALLVETASAAFWPLVSWVAAFAGLWLMEIPTVFGKAAEIITLVIFLTGSLSTLKHGLKNFRLPGRVKTDRRLESDSGLSHRPITALEDRLANPEKEQSRRLWQKNRAAALAVIGKVRLPTLRPVMGKADPVALRAAAMLLLATGLIIAGQSTPERLARGLMPFVFSGQSDDESRLTLWITPPEYTGLGQIVVGGGTKKHAKPVDVPEGSIIKARVSDGLLRPYLKMGQSKHALAHGNDDTWSLEIAASPGDSIELKQWPASLGVLTRYLADLPPEIRLEGPPETISKGQTRIPLVLKDDYGVKELRMMLTLSSTVQEAPLGAPVEDIRAVMTPPGQEAKIQPLFDLAWHPWAGLPVTIVLSAEDEPGHLTALPPLNMTLPEREFFHPVAKKIVNMRKRLIWTPLASAQNVGFELRALLPDPAAFGGDPVAFLSIRSAASRLLIDGENIESVVAVIPQLWDTALRIEDGNLSLAARNLRDAQRNLERLLANPNSTQEEIARAMDQLRAAMAEYFQEFARELQKRMANGEQMPQLSPEMFGQNMTAEDLAAMIEQLQAQALSGDRDAARQMLSQLENLMNSLDPSLSMQIPKDMQFMMNGINEIQELIEKQQFLLDQTKKLTETMTGSGQAPQQQYPEYIPIDPGQVEQWGEGNIPPPPQPPAQPQQSRNNTNTQGSRAEQEGLRIMLGRLMLDADEQLGTIPEGMQKAEQEMRGSARQLGQNMPEASIPHQEKVIEYLQQSMNSLSQQLQARMKQMNSLSLGSGQFDPLGRPMTEGEGNSSMPGSRVKIPEEAERKRVQEILRILRERSGEFERPDYELEYFRRLMKQF